MIIALIEVVVGTFVLFTIARIAYTPLVTRSGWFWVALVAILAITNMLLHRFVIGSSINPPFFTAVFFGITLAGLTPKESATGEPWHKRGIYGVVVGSLIGWASYAEVVST
ncbi:hypothetical protein CLU85_3704 [Acidovorax sp. 69]|uniref:hypothetical protein n=1 Tax=Acidovorax sp. 69 TaxID=2035202 RepID=UPI000C24D17A|nr:hypothetical protein [Acidovorax sp. 69]PJI98868.1 hypothetical protein CLU85_3704 [Acidovorax sp. 69]